MPPQARKVLLVDDDHSVLVLLSKILQSKGYEVDCVDRGQKAIERIMEDVPSFVVTDWEMPDMDGIDVCRQVRELELPNYVYMIVVTGRSAAEHIIQAMEAGADDFITKPVDRGELIARMQAGQRVLGHESQLTRLAYSDALTELPTRRLFSEQSKVELQRARRYRRPASCIIFDIDYFKRVNDTYGHAAGDEVLKSVASLLKKCSRQSDIICRFGGEEFSAILPETNEIQAAMWAEHLRTEISKCQIKFGDELLTVTSSFGVAELIADIESVDELISLADQCLYAAKDLGRDRVVCFRDLNSRGHESDAGDSNRWFHGVVARDVMTSVVGSLDPEDTIADASQYFLQFRICSAPVVDETGKLLGIVSEKDLISVLRNPDAISDQISTVMRTNVVCYDEEAPIETIYDFLCRVAIRNVIVIRDGQPVGFIGRNSFLRWVINYIALRSFNDASWRLATHISSPSLQRSQLGKAVNVLKESTARLHAELRENETSDIGPQVIGTVSQIQELLNDVLSGSGYLSRSDFGALS